jgi:hypothetical protein
VGNRKTQTDKEKADARKQFVRSLM